MSVPTIFVSVASYCDPMLGFTLASLRSSACDPSRVFVGVVEQQLPFESLQPHDEWSRAHVRWTRVNALEARGPCWARSLAMALYQGEDWFLQVDSHTWFEPAWDERLIGWAERCATGNSRSILTCYPNPFVMSGGHPVARGVTQRVLASVVSASAAFAIDHPVLAFEGVGVEIDQPVVGFHVAGGCLFAPGCIAEELPYDPRLYFHGEEQAYSLRAWTRGWDIMHIPGMPMYHLYTQPGSMPRPMHWSPEMDRIRPTQWQTLDEFARRRLQDILEGNASLGPYGLGNVRSLEEFATFSGIDYSTRTIAPRARKVRFGYT